MPAPSSPTARASRRSDNRPRPATPASPLRVWFNAVRPRSFTTSTVPIIAATALGMVDGYVHVDLFVLMLLASIFTHAACNLTNDYFDDRRGVDTHETLGQGGALQRGELSHDQLRSGIAVCFGIAILCAVPIIAVVGPVIILIGIASAAAAFFYTAGPFPLAYYALGEVTVFLAMGVGMVCGAYYVNTGSVSTAAWLLGIAIGLLAAAFLHANNIRDIETDRARNKRTLANLLPRKAWMFEYIALVLLPYGLATAMFAVQPELYPILIVWFAFPVSFKLIERMALAKTREHYNVLTRKTAGLHLRFSTLMSLGLAIAAVVAQ